MVAFGVMYPYRGDEEAVTVHSAEPRIVENSADATFEFYVCAQEPKETDATATTALGVAGPADFARYCPDRRPVGDGTVLDTGDIPTQQLVMVVTVTKPGVVVTRGVDLTYSHGLQRGTQSIGTHVRIRST